MLATAHPPTHFHACKSARLDMYFASLPVRTHVSSDNNGTLDPAEFVEFARSMMKSGPDMFFARVGKHTAINTAGRATNAIVASTPVALSRASQLPVQRRLVLAVLHWRP
jgi:hypothetical protein